MKIVFGIILAYMANQISLIAAEEGMPQLDPKYWASQVFWLIVIFTALYLSISKLFVPKIKSGLDDRNDKIKNDLDEAKNLKEKSEQKQIEYEKIIEEAKKEVQKMIFESKNKLEADINLKNKAFDAEITKEIDATQKEINTLNKESLNDILLISESITSQIIESISGEKLNESSIKAAISEVSKNNLRKYI
tara:strand:+ start:241 stop:816 length:576 start_codon:yes stop_codon:yes gene_type:complete